MVTGIKKGTQIYIEMFKRINKTFVKKGVIPGGKIYNITQVQQRKKNGITTIEVAGNHTQWGFEERNNKSGKLISKCINRCGGALGRNIKVRNNQWFKAAKKLWFALNGETRYMNITKSKDCFNWLTPYLITIG